MVQRMIVEQTCKTYGTDWEAVKAGDGQDLGSNAKVGDWYCYPGGFDEVDLTKCKHASNESDIKKQGE